VPLAPTVSRGTWTHKRELFRVNFTVVQTVEQAQNQLHHSKAILSFLQSVHQGKPSLLQYLQEAERTFLQALENYQNRNYEEARECAAACCELCNLIEILVLRAFQSAAQLASVAENDFPAPLSGTGIRADLHRVDEILGRIQWIVQNGTLPSQDREQVQKLVSWSESLHRCATRLFDIGAVEETMELLRAAQSAAGAAEHICRKSYVTNSNVALFQPIAH
jgi:flagellar biosynthesis/type III secretory pathway chaperone